jgi:hypothetical protein
MNEIARKVLVAEENGVTKIFFDENLYKVNKEELTELSLATILNGETTGCDLSRLEYGEIICHTNPARIADSKTKKAVKLLLDYIVQQSISPAES